MNGGPGSSRAGGLPLLPALLAPPAVGLAFLLGGPQPMAGRICLPLLATAAVYPVFALLIVRGRSRAAILAACLWAASLSASVIGFTRFDPERTAGIVLNGPAYRDEMFAFIAAGEGRESDPTRFIPQHALHLGLFLLATAASGGVLGLLMGAALVGYMSFYVGALTLGPEPVVGALLGWPPWAILRVTGFILIGTALSRPILGRLTGLALPRSGDVRLYLLAAGCLVLDVVLKALLATTWAGLLRPCLG